MGLCDIIPGISGGTIAFITGIYERLLLAIKNVLLFPQQVLASMRGKITKKAFAKSIKSMDLWFLITLAIGIGIAVFAGAWIISYLLEIYLVYTLMFFIGLIIASAVLIFKTIKDHNLKTRSFAVLGLILGGLLVLIVPLQTTNPSIFYIVLAGFLAISALFLPGVSGSFILIILGMYEFMIHALKTLSFSTILPFIIGAILGVIIISKIINYLFSVNKSGTLYFLLGLVIGSLIVPAQKILLSWGGSNLIIAIICLVVGLGVVLGVHFTHIDV